MLQLIEVTKVFVSSLSARESSFGGILSLPLDLLPSKNFKELSSYEH